MQQQTSNGTSISNGVVATGVNVSRGNTVETATLLPSLGISTTTTAQSAAPHQEQVDAPGVTNDQQPAAASRSTQLPQWIDDYITWHAQQRAQFPDQLLITHPDAPPLSIRICPYQCGGLHDRMIGLPQFLYEASLSKRVVLIKWYHHANFELESYLVPATAINWTLPMVPTVTDTPTALLAFANRSEHIMVRQVRDHTTILDASVQTPKDGTFELPPFGSIWHTFFQPSPRLQQLLSNQTTAISQPYAALHLRLRHPANYNMRRDTGMDLTGLPWDRLYERQTVMEAAIRALNCTKTMLLLRNKTSRLLPLYLFSDSQEIIHFLVHEAAANNETTHQQPNGRLQHLHAIAHDLVQDWQLLARNTEDTSINAHLDAPNHTWAAYAGTFVDLFMALQAQCLSLGVGNFAVLALLISPKDDQCVMNYIPRTGRMAKAWGYHQLQSAQVCDLPSKIA